MSVLEAINEFAIRRLLSAWFDALDQHRPIQEVFAMLADEGLDMRFPGVEIRGYSDFATWYDDVTTRFFDERHEIHRDSLKIVLHDAEAALDFVVGWQASWWEVPEARSRRVVMDATQHWTVRASHKNPAGVEIVTYIADAVPFDFSQGFSRLPPPTNPGVGSHGRAAEYPRVPRSLDTHGENYELPVFATSERAELMGKRVLIMTADGPEFPEIDVPLHFLRARGAEVLIAGQDWIFESREPAGYIVIGQWLADDRCVRADLRLSDVDINKFDVLFIPGGAWNPDMLRTDEQALRIVRQARASGILIVSLCHGPQVLINAASDGSTFPVGTHITGVLSIRQDLCNARFTVHHEDATVYDEQSRLLTARDPKDLGSLCAEMQRLLRTKSAG